MPTNFTLFIWNRDISPRCRFCNFSTESMAHVLNGCQVTFRNFYNKRHNRVADEIFENLKDIDRNYTVYNNKNIETIFPCYREELKQLPHRKPDIVRIDCIKRICPIIEITVCYALYFDTAYKSKNDKYTPLKNELTKLGYDVTIMVLCFGSLGSIMKECHRNILKITNNKEKTKSLLKWCSISYVIAANYIWRHRVKKLVSLGYI